MMVTSLGQKLTTLMNTNIVGTWIFINFTHIDLSLLFFINDM